MSSDNLKVPRYKNFYDLVRRKGPLGFAKDFDRRNEGIYIHRQTVEYEYIHAMLDLNQKLTDENFGSRKKYSLLQSGFFAMAGDKDSKLEVYWREKALANGKESEEADPMVFLGIDEMERISNNMHAEADLEVKDMDRETLKALAKEQKKLIEESKAKIIAEDKIQKEREMELLQLALFAQSKANIAAADEDLEMVA